MKKLFILIIFGSFALNTQAQYIVGATIGPQIPFGTMGKILGVGFGFTATGKYELNKKMVVGANLGFYGFSGKTVDGIQSSGSMVPITGLFEYHFGKGKVKPYAGAELGFFSYNSTAAVSGFAMTVTKMCIGFAPTAGALYGLNKKISLCANLKFNVVATTGGASTFMGINVGAFYKIK